MYLGVESTNTHHYSAVSLPLQYYSIPSSLSQQTTDLPANNQHNFITNKINLTLTLDHTPPSRKSMAYHAMNSLKQSLSTFVVVGWTEG